jgi:chaperone required for assembly of F1-ATPase
VQTPARNALKIKALPLAEAIADEWRNQGDDIIPDTMPLSQMAMTLVDRVIPNRAILGEEALGYFDTDLVCYRAAEPPEYCAAQNAKWNPFTDWFADVYGEALQMTTGLAPLTQSAALHKKVAAEVAAMDESEFMAVYLATLGTGSLVLALAFVAGAFSPVEIGEAAFVEEKLKDEIYLSDIYGTAPDQERRYTLLFRDLETLQQLLMLSSAAF